MELSEGDRVGVRPPPDAGGLFKKRGDRMDSHGLALNPLIVRPLIGRLPPGEFFGTFLLAQKAFLKFLFFGGHSQEQAHSHGTENFPHPHDPSLRQATFGKPSKKESHHCGNLYEHSSR